MAIPILNHLDVKGNLTLNDNKLQDFVVDHSTTGNAGDTAGKLIYDSGSLKFYNGSSWQTLGTGSGSGTVTQVDGGDGLTGSVTSSGSLAVGAGTGMTVNTNDIAVTAAQTGITSIYNTSLAVGYGASHANIDFSTDNAIIFDIDGTQQIKLQDGALVPITDNDIDLGTSSLEFKDAYFDGTVTSDAFAGPLTGSLTIGGHLVDDIDVTSEASDANDHLMTALAIKNRIEDYGYITASSTSTLTNKTIAASQVTEISNLTAAEGEQLEAIGSTTISATQWGYLGAASGAITNTDVDVSVSNLTARLPQVTSSVTIGDATDVTVTTSGDLVVTGDLTVSGDTITANVGTLTVEDKNIVLNYASGSDTSSTANGSGITIQDAVDASNDATILWDATNDEFDFSHPINVTGKVTATGTSVFATLDISGDVDVDGTLEADAITLNGTALGSLYSPIAGSSSIVTTGALNSGSITSGFGTIDTGSSAITTTGLISGGSLDIDDVVVNGSTIGHTNDTDLMTVASGVLTVAGEVDATSLDISGDADIDGTLEADAITVAGTALNTVVDNRIKAVQKTATIDVSELDSSALKCNIAHGLTSNNIIVKLYDGTTYLDVFADVDRVDTDTIQIVFSAAPSNDIVVVIQEIIGDNIGAGSDITYPSS